MIKEIPRGTVLAVDDDPMILNLVGAIIKLSGLNPEASQNPHEAIELYRANAENIPVVVTDRNYGLQDINGDLFAETVRNIANSHVPPLNVRIIMCTADGLNPEQEAKILRVGVDQIVKKPFRPAVLKAEIIRGRDLFVGERG